MTMLNNGNSYGEISKIIQTVKYCIIDNNVYDITNCVHPGGQFILEAINGRDIGCYFYGGYALESSGFQPHDHTSFAMSYLE